MKNKLKEQIDEAKKIKRSNKNLSDSVIHLNSLLSSIGALDHYQCPECPKAFRTKEFLLSHLQRKHPQNISLVNIDSCFVRSSREGNDVIISGRQNISTAVTAHKQIQFPERELKNENYIKGCSEYAHTARTTFPTGNIYDQPSTSTIKSNNGFIYENNNNVGELKSYLFQNESEGPVKINKQIDSPSTQKSTDIDLYKVNEMQKSFNVMNDIILKLTKDVEEQKKIMKEEFDKRYRESLREREEKEEEKVWEESNNNKMIKDLEDKIEYLQTQQSKNLDEEKQKLKILIEKQEKEIKQLTKNLKEEPKKNNQNEKMNQNLKSEIKILKDEIVKIQEHHNQSIEKVKSDLKKQYEIKLKDEVENTIKVLNMKHQKSMKPKSTKVRKASKQIKVKEKKGQKQDKKRKLKNSIKSFHSDIDEDTSKRNSETKNSKRKTDHYDDLETYTKNDDESSSNSNDDKKHNKTTKLKNSSKFFHPEEEDTSKWYSSPNSDSSNHKEHDKKSKLKNDDKAFHFETEEDTSKWYSSPSKNVLKSDSYDNQNIYTKNKKSNSDSSSEEEHDKIIEPRYVNVKSSSVSLQKREMPFNDDTETSEDDENKSSQEKIRSVNLKTLVQRNPNLWHQMKKVMEEELTRRLKQYDIDEENEGITHRDLRSHILHLIRTRKQLTDKYNNFDSLRKSINNQVDKIVDEKKETMKSKPIKTYEAINDSPSKTGFIKGFKNWRAKLKNSKASISSNKDDHHPDVLDMKSEPKEEKEVRLQELSKYGSSTSYNSDSDKSSKTEVDIHNERGHSIRRNLFSDSPLPVTPKNDNQDFFSNKTYGNIDEWDSESTESSNSKPTENGKSQNSLDKQMFYPETAPSTSKTAFQYQEIKLKKPSGPMIKDLSKKIENQLRNRSSKKLAGSVDLAAKHSSQSDNEMSDDIKEIESIRMSD